MYNVYTLMTGVIVFIHFRERSILLVIYEWQHAGGLRLTKP